MLVLKLSGSEIDNPAFLAQLGRIIATLPPPLLLVHGGGRQIDLIQQQVGLQPRYLDGMRVTDAASLSLVKMVLAGRINKRLVAVLSNFGLDVLGLSGVDRTSIRAKKLEHPNGDLGYVGQVTEVRTEVFQSMLDDGIIPVLSPICYGPEGNIFNVNADQVAAAMAVALAAKELVFISNVPGVLRNNQLLPRLTLSDIKLLTAEGIIQNGMMPKIQAALQAINGGVTSVRITNLDSLQTQEGTVIANERCPVTEKSSQLNKRLGVVHP